MLCRRCRRHVHRAARACTCCGAPVGLGTPAYELVLPDRTRLAIAGQVSVGRGSANTLRLDDPSVSRRHARIVATPVGPIVEDRGSRHGTFLDGQPVMSSPLADGSCIRVGDSELLVERVRDRMEPGRTIMAPPGPSVHVGGPSQQRSTTATPRGFDRPRLRSSCALKRVGDGEPAVLKDLRNGSFVRLDEEDAALLVLLDGRRTMERLARDAELVSGSDGPARLLALLAELADRGLIHGIERRPETVRGGVLHRVLRPRELTWKRAGAAFDRIYAAGGWLLFTAPARALAAVLAVVGLAAVAFLVAAGGRTPFVVAGDVTLGSLVFVAGRFLTAALHELAHGLTISSFGRRVSHAGVKIVVALPYLFVDTSDAWFENRRRRIAIAAAGPMSDLLVAGTCSLLALVVAGVPGDAAFQLAFGALLGALFNLNPLLERDGYHVLVDALKLPGLRARASRQVVAVLSGRERPEPEARALTIYGAAVLLWSLVAVGLVVIASRRYAPALSAYLPPAAVRALLVTLYATVLAPPAITVARALWARRRLA